MPLFEYRCRECGHVTEFLEKSDAAAKHLCEQCGSAKTERLLSTFSVKAGGSSSPARAACPTGTCPLS